MEMRKSVSYKVTARPISNRRIQVRTSVKSGNVTRTKTQTIRMK